jgi:hypothetical protein
MPYAAERHGIRHAVGLQGQVSPAINYARDLTADGYVGRVLTAMTIGCAPDWGATIDRAFQADLANGANPLDDHRGPLDRCTVPLPRRIPRADRVGGEPARSDSVGRQELTGPACRQRHCRRRDGRFVLSRLVLFYPHVE